MRDRPSHVFLDRADRYAQPRGHVPVAKAFQSPEHEHRACPLGQFEQRGAGPTQSFLALNNAVRGKIRTSVSIIVEKFVPIRRPHPTSPPPVTQYIRRSFEDVTAQILDAVQIAAPG